MNGQVVSGGFFDERRAGTGPTPFDLPHLARQTMGDPALALEVLGMFQTQTSILSKRRRI